MGQRINFDNDQDVAITAMIALPNKILWGTFKKVGGGKYKPMVFFTNIKGDMLTVSTGDGAKNVVYPGKTCKGDGYVRAAYNPTSDLLILTWTAADAKWWESRRSQESYFRVMDSNGKFKTKVLSISKPKTSFQGPVQPVYNSVDNKFLLVWEEFKKMYEPPADYSSSKDTFGYFLEASIWARSVDDNGKFLDKKPQPLVRKVKKRNTGLAIAYWSSGVTYNPDDNQYFVTYLLYDFSRAAGTVFGLIY